MEFNEKLQELRSSRGLTQEELAEALFVSRTAYATSAAFLLLMIKGLILLKKEKT